MASQLQCCHSLLLEIYFIIIIYRLIQCTPYTLIIKNNWLWLIAVNYTAILRFSRSVTFVYYERQALAVRYTLWAGGRPWRAPGRSPSIYLWFLGLDISRFYVYSTEQGYYKRKRLGLLHQLRHPIFRDFWLLISSITLNLVKKKIGFTSAGLLQWIISVWGSNGPFWALLDC